MPRSPLTSNLRLHLRMPYYKIDMLYCRKIGEKHYERYGILTISSVGLSLIKAWYRRPIADAVYKHPHLGNQSRNILISTAFCLVFSCRPSQIFCRNLGSPMKDTVVGQQAQQATTVIRDPHSTAIMKMSTIANRSAHTNENGYSS